MMAAGERSAPRLTFSELIGRGGSRERVPTPALLVDLDALERNIGRMAAFAQRRGIALRPHVKTHKCVEIARRQLRAGAVGLSCATLDEAEVMSAGTGASVLITSPIVSDEKITRFIALARACQNAAVVVDHPEGVRRIAVAAQGAGLNVPVFVDLDLGHHRSGALTPQDAIVLAEAIRKQTALTLAGIQAYAGHLQHVTALAERKQRTIEISRAIREVRAAVEAMIGTTVPVSGGGTGTCAIDAEERALTELQVGSYVFLDTDYAAVDLGLAEEDTPEVALFVRASVISVNCSDFVSIDAGTKSFALNGPAPRCVSVPWGAAGFRFMGDEHAHLLLPKVAPKPSLGVGLEFVVSHCDPTVHCFDHYYVAQGADIIDIWNVDARGRR